MIMIFLVMGGIANARYYYTPPESLLLEDVNPTIKRKIQTRYTSKDEIPSQYKGKFIYNPALTNNLTNYRKKRIYTSFYLTSAIPEITNFHYYDNSGNALGAEIRKLDRAEYTFGMAAGAYLYDAMAVEAEYIVTKTSIIFRNKINDNLTQIPMLDGNGNQILDYFGNPANTPQSVDILIFDSYSFFLNASFESNYSRFIPIFGAGIGIINYNVSTTYFNGETVSSRFKMKATLGYNYFVGAEIAVNNDFLITLKYKVVQSQSTDFIKDDRRTSRIKFDFENNFVSFGVKYIW
jgi:opacity protein-like surface antigen